MLNLPPNNTALPQLTQETLFLKGRLALWKYSIPFFTANVSLEYAAANFKLFEDLAQADTGEWTLEELFQRDISWSRVDTDILQYLKNPARPQFFNSLTVALLPSGMRDFGQPHGPGITLPAMQNSNLGSPVGVGGIQIQYFGSDEDVVQGPGMLRWSTSDVDAVAVDGQHRLAAIKRFVAQTKREVWKDASVPVIFVIADERVGFSTPHAEGEAMRTVGALRALFIDLNKNARPVSPTRNILLDDLDVVSVSTRALIGRSLTVTADDEARIPLPLVDWLTDRNKIEDGPFLTTVMLLSEAIARLLDVPDPRFQEEDDSVGKVGGWLDRMLPPSNDTERASIMQQVSECAVQQTKLTWLPEHMSILRSSFEREWRPHFHSLFSQYAPYAQLWDYSAQNDLLTPQFVNLYLAADVMPAPYGQQRERRLIDTAKQSTPGWSVEKYYEKPLGHIQTEIKGDSMAYKVVFQRALLRAFVAFIPQPAYFLSIDLDRRAATDLFLRAMNRLHEKGAVEKSYAIARNQLFWAGSGLTADGTIEFTSAGADRLRDWLLGFVAMMSTPAPTFARLQEEPGSFLHRTFANGRGVVYKGIEKLARARDLDADDPDVVMGLIGGRYDRLRVLARD